MRDIIKTIMEYKEEANRNIVICAPKMGKEPFEKRSRKLRVYAYGGLIAEFGYSASDNLCISFLSKSYYAEEKKYITGEGQRYLSSLPKGNCIQQKKEILLDKNYWEYASIAAENKFTKGDTPKERNIESTILEQYMNRSELSWCIFDMEFSAPKAWKEKNGIMGKPDLVCFDGEKFGLIELKYNNRACDDGKNKSGLNKHFNDLKRTAQHAEPIIEELKRRVEVCDSIYTDKVIRKSMCDKIKSAANEVWFGFLFVNDDGSDPKKKIKNLEDTKDEARIMCVNKYSEIEEWKWSTRSELLGE